MDVRTCLKILELNRTASIDDVNRAYKDIVSVWHPDRFAHNPRLQRKAEAKIKEINVAYEILKSFYARKQALGQSQKGSLFATDTGIGRFSTDMETRDGTEVAFEIGTRFILSTWSYLSSRLRRMAETHVIKREAERQKRVEGS